jgi:hypothetical protein
LLPEQDELQRVRTWTRSRRNEITTWRARNGIGRLPWQSEASTGGSVAQAGGFPQCEDAAGEVVVPTYGRGKLASLGVPKRLTIDPAGIRQQHL